MQAPSELLVVQLVLAEETKWRRLGQRAWTRTTDCMTTGTSLLDQTFDAQLVTVQCIAGSSEGKHCQQKASFLH